MGCQISEARAVRVHEYDCFDTRPPACPQGDLAFHPECIGAVRATRDGRPFDTLAGDIERNGDAGRRLVIKMDVEGAEWESLLSAPDEALEQIDQLAIEFPGVQDRRYVALVRRLKAHFHVAHLHFNNNACLPEAAPFPAIAFEVLFVNKTIATVDPAGGAA